MVRPLRALVLADTHVVAGRTLPEVVWDEVRRADVVIHAGDVTSAELLDELAALVPVHAVLGNNDVGLEDRLPERLEVDLAGVRLAVAHDSGPRRGRPARLARWFPDADVVVFGHSHQPVDEVGEGSQLLFNPGSPTQRRRQPAHTFGRLELAAGAVAHHEVVVVPDVPTTPDRSPRWIGVGGDADR